MPSIEELVRFNEQITLDHIRLGIPLAEEDPVRKCHSAECWCCHGTGVSQRPDIPGVCEMNDKIPF